MQKHEFAFPICLLYDCKLAVSMTSHIQDKFLTVRTDQQKRQRNLLFIWCTMDNGVVWLSFPHLQFSLSTSDNTVPEQSQRIATSAHTRNGRDVHKNINQTIKLVTATKNVQTRVKIVRCAHPLALIADGQKFNLG